MGELEQKAVDRLDAVAELLAGNVPVEQIEEALQRADATIAELAARVGMDEVARRLRARWDALLIS